VHFYFQESFEETNASFFSAKNGKEGVEKFKELNPDIVLMDIQMPVMDGFEACSKIKDINSQTLVIMQTAFNSKSDFVQAKKVGADEIITKPIDKDRAFQIISNLMNIKKN
jgi:two-component system chemotaxis response regulator CheY